MVSPNEKSIFLNALALSTPEQRGAYLDEACRGDADLRAGVEALLAAAERLGRPTPPVAGAAETATASRAAEPGGTISHYPAPDSGATAAGRYKLLEVIGEGGMGTVWMAEQTEPVRRRVAVKLVRSGMDSKQVVARFEAERQALALMDHPNIAKVLDGGMTTDERPFFVMELVKGTPITRYCDDHCLPLRDRLGLFVRVCQAVQHAHQKGVIHRDIKPSNVLVAPYDGESVPKVIDFGIAKAAGQPLTDKTLFTGFGAVIGTPVYMSPEQAELNNADIDTRSDVYSLGVVLYELLTGTTPLTHQRVKEVALLEVLRLVREEEAPTPSARLSTTNELPAVAARRGLQPKRLTGFVRGELDWIVLKALEKDRSRRYDTATAFAQDVERYLADEPVQACPPSVSYRMRKFYRRNRLQVIASVVIALALVVGLAGTSVGMVWADRERANATTARDEKQGALDRLSEEQRRTTGALALETQARQQAMSALMRLTDHVVERQMIQQPQLTAADRAFIDSILAEFEAFARVSGDGEVSRAVRAQGHYRVGQLTARLGEFARARRAYEEARAHYRHLAADFPGNLDYSWQLAECHGGLSTVLRQLGMSAESVVESRQAIELFTRLSAAAPEVKYREGLANAQLELGMQLRRLGRHKEAESAIRIGLAIRQRLADDFPEDPGKLSASASAHHTLSAHLSHSNEPEQAEAECRHSIDLYKRLADKFPGNAEYTFGLANGLASLAAGLNGRGKFSEAETECRLAIGHLEKLGAVFPGSPRYSQSLAEAYNTLTMSLISQQKTPEAVKTVHQAIDLGKRLTTLRPEVPEYKVNLARGHNELGVMYFRQGNLQEAEEQFRLGLAIHKQLAADFRDEPRYRMGLGIASANLGHVRLRAGRPTEALDWYQQAIGLLSPTGLQPRAIKDARDALRQVHAGRAGALCELGRYSEAIPAWDRAIELTAEADRETVLWNRAGLPLAAMGRLDEAIAYANKLLELEPKNAKAYAVLAQARLFKKRPDEALAASHKALAIEPKNSTALAVWGDVLSAKGEWAGLIEVYDRLSEALPPAARPALRSRRGTAYAKIGVWDKALADLTAANPQAEFSDAAPQVGCLLLLTGDEKGYRAFCPKAAEYWARKRDNPYEAVRLGTLVADTPVAPAQVVKWAEDAAKNDKSAWKLHALGRAYYRDGQYDRAERACRDSLKQDAEWPGRVLNWLLLAMAHERLGNADEARKWLAKAGEWHDGLPRTGDKTRAVCPLQLFVTDWLEFHVLLAEARRTVRPSEKK